ncbi:MAG TPA: hypothetical protein VKS79_00125 [Gemmataceae bacterium]|nr:hypothetical protein [Gemmataceae bacterium]
MVLLRRLSGAILLFFSAVGTIGCAVVIIGTWMAHQKASHKIQAISNRIDAGLARASAANQNVRGAAEKARADVRSVDRESADFGAGGERGARAARAARKLIEQKAAPDLDELGGRLDSLSDAAAVVASLLDTFQEVAPRRGIRIDPDQLKQRAGDAQQISGLLHHLENALDDGDKQASPQNVAATTNRVDAVLQKCLETVDDWQSQLDNVREDLAKITRRTIGWITVVAVGLTVLFAWIGLGQICLFARGLRWLRL